MADKWYAHYTPIEILEKRVWPWCQRESSTKSNILDILGLSGINGGYLDTPKLIISKKLFFDQMWSALMYTARPVLPSDFIPFDRANQELQNAFLDESLAQKEAKI